MKGKIKAVFNRGKHGSYGFIKDEEQQDRWFNADNLENSTIGDVEVGDEVTFVPTRGGRNNEGYRAENIVVVK